MSGWYLKKPERGVYGPVDLLQIRDWAATGRVAPDDLVSRDGEQWTPATREPVLEMVWNVEMADGTAYGPVALLALKDLLFDGTLLPQARIRNVETGFVTSVAEALMPAILSELRPLEEPDAVRTPAIATVGAENGMEAIESASRPLSPTEDNWQQNFRERDNLERAVQKWKRLYEEEQQSGQNLQTRNEEMIRQLTQDKIALQETLESTKRELEQLRQFQQTIASEEGPTGNLWNAFFELSRTFQVLSGEFASKMDEVRNLREQIVQLEQDDARRVEHLESLLSREREALLETSRRLSRLEEAHAQTVRSYREMNDQFIRIRETVGSLPPSPYQPAPAEPAGGPAAAPAERRPGSSRIRRISI